MFWDLFKKKPAPKPEQEKKGQERQCMPIGDFCKDLEGFYKG